MARDLAEIIEPLDIVKFSFGPVHGVVDYVSLRNGLMCYFVVWEAESFMVPYEDVELALPYPAIRSELELVAKDKANV